MYDKESRVGFFEDMDPGVPFRGLSSGLAVHTGMTHEEIMEGSQAPTGLIFEKDGDIWECLGGDEYGRRVWKITEPDGNSFKWETL